MRLFIKNILLYLIPLFIFGAWAEYRTRNIPNNYSLKAVHFENFPPSKVETLILGSSHSLKGINPSHLSSNAFNYAHITQSFDIDYAILTSETLPSLNTVILSISLFSFYEILRESPQAKRISKYTVYTPIDVHATLFEHLALSNWEETRGFLFNRIDSSLCSIQSDGWEPLNPADSEVKLNQTALRAFNRHTIHGLSLNNVALESFENIVNWCKSRNIRLIVVATPAWHAYRELAVHSHQWTQTKSILTNFPHAHFLNWLENPPIVLESLDFHDADHLSETGANKLSVALYEWLEESELK